MIQDITNNDHKTIGDLAIIIGKLDDLPEMIKTNHIDINMIKMTIRALCEDQFDFHTLTQAQFDTLLFTLSEASKIKIKCTKSTLSSDDVVMKMTPILLTDLIMLCHRAI